MKNILLSIALISASALSTASETADKQASCKEYHGLATVIMESRQLNIDITKMMEVAKGNVAIMEIVKMAYKKPAYSVKSNQQREIKQFANDVYMICLELK